MVDDDDESVDSIGLNEALPDFEEIARDIQNRASGRVLSKETEARLFREFFGTSVRIAGSSLFVTGSAHGEAARGICFGPSIL